MKKNFLSFSLIVAFALFATFSHPNVGINADRFLTPNISILDNNTQPNSQPPTPTPAPTPKQTGKFKNGNYVGPVVDAYYGNIQIKAIIQGDRLADVVFLQYPNDRSTSIEINTQAMPYLKSEAIQAQSAKVNIVSGASDSSKAFIESLGSALAKATN